MKGNNRRVVYHPGQEIVYWSDKEKKYQKAYVITAGGGRIKLKDNGSILWVDADKAVK